MKKIIILVSSILALIACTPDTKKQNGQPNATFSIPFVYKGFIFINPDTKTDTTTYFIFDTGSSNCVLDSSYASNYLDNTEISYLTVSSLGQKKLIPVIPSHHFIFDSVTFKTESIVIADLKKMVEIEDGIISWKLLNNYTIYLDFENNKIDLFDSSVILNYKNYTQTSFKYYNQQIQVPLSIYLNDTANISGLFTFDTGSNMPVIVFADNYVENWRKSLSEPRYYSIQNNATIVGKLNMEIVKIKQFAINNFQIDSPYIYIKPIQRKTSSLRRGTIGLPIISQFNWIIDFKNRIIHFRPNHLYKNKFHQPKPGLRIVKSGNNYVVQGLITNTAAHKSGIEIGHQITRINNKPINNYDYFEIHDILNYAKKINLTFMNNQTETTIDIVPENFK